jgi:hypothetical protein
MVKVGAHTSATNAHEEKEGFIEWRGLQYSDCEGEATPGRLFWFQGIDDLLKTRIVP